MSSTNDKSQAKKAAGYAAAKLIEDGMVVGLGTGSTAYFFIEALIERCRSGLFVKAVSSSQASKTQASSGGIEMVDLNTLDKIDMTVDGADEVDKQKRLIKGGGGALLREKIVANASHEMIVIVDESKVVERLGSFPLPVEINPFGFDFTKRLIEKKGFKATARKNGNQLYVTDNGNYILDLKFDHLPGQPEEHDSTLKKIPGVLETGFFFDLAGRVIVGCSSGDVKLWS